MKTKRHFILVVVAFVLVAGLLTTGIVIATVNNPPIVQASNKEARLDDKVRKRMDIVMGALFAKEVVINMRNNEIRYATCDRNDILVGLDGVTVIVDGLNPKVEKYGLTQQLLQTDTELWLRQHGIRVFTDEEVDQILTIGREQQKKRWEALSYKALSLPKSLAQKDSDGHFFQCLRQVIEDYFQGSCMPPPYLSVNVTTAVSEEIHRVVFSINLTLRDEVYLRRSGALRVAAIWETGGVAGCSESDLTEYAREFLRNNLDEFINDYLAANPARINSESDDEQYIVGTTEIYDPKTEVEKPGAHSEKQKDQVGKNVLSVSNEWSMFETTTIEGWVKKVERGTIFKTTSGNIYEVVDLVILLEFELSPDATVLTNGQFYKLFIKGIGEPLLCRKLNRGNNGIASDGAVIEAQVTNNFEGFEYGKIYKLSNGQVWEQIDPYIYIRIAVMPKVTIWQNGPVYRMKVDGIDRAVNVHQLK